MAKVRQRLAPGASLTHLIARSGIGANRVGKTTQSLTIDGQEFLLSQAVQLAFRHVEQGDLDSAKAVAEKVLQIDGTLAPAHHILAVVHYQRGDPVGAIRGYQKAIDLDPLYSEALNNLGIALQRIGRLSEAEASYRKAIELTPNLAQGHNNLGTVLNSLGRTKEAAACYRAALAIDPALPDAHNNLGNSLRKDGRPDEAVASYRRAIEVSPNFAEAHFNLGCALGDSGRPRDAASCFQAAVILRPDYAEARNNLGVTLKALGSIDEAIQCFRDLIQARPDYAVAFANLGSALTVRGANAEALGCYEQAIRLAPAVSHYWVGWADCVSSLSADQAQFVQEKTLLEAFKMECVDPRSLERASSAILRNKPEVNDLLATVRRLDGGAGQIEERLLAGDPPALFEMPLLLATLEEVPICDPDLEYLFTVVRQLLLRTAIASPQVLDSNARTRRLAYSLAMQCFENEYVYALTSNETASVAGLVDRVTQALTTGADYPTIWLYLVAAYRPLHQLPCVGLLNVSGAADPNLRMLVDRQIVQFRQEQAARVRFPSLSESHNPVSALVRAQYEDNPYPRWRHVNNPRMPKAIHQILAELFPGIAIPDTSPLRPDILVAGCGTGRHAASTAIRFRNANVLAVDLSTASLALAERACRSLGITNVRFAQADLMELGNFDQTFDLIECVGVLHHLSDPMQGWRILATLLRPGGYMNVGLYSRSARAEISKARELIVQRGHTATVDSIRQFRRELMADSSHFGNTILRSQDFYCVSGCRDLLFHVEEHLFSLPEIAACLEELGLEFLGFEMARRRVMVDYRLRFPSDPRCTSLENWAQYETENPNTFAGMYQFWVRSDRPMA